MMRDDSSGGWLPMGGGGLSNVSVRKRKIHHHDQDLDQTCRHEYLIHGRRISDNSVKHAIFSSIGFNCKPSFKNVYERRLVRLGLSSLY
jgi:hypothetical protein